MSAHGRLSMYTEDFYNHEKTIKMVIVLVIIQDYVLAMSHDDENGTHLTASNIKETPPKTVTKGEVDSIGVVISIKVIDADVLQPTYPSKYIHVFFDFSLTVKAAPHAYVIRIGQP